MYILKETTVAGSLFQLSNGSIQGQAGKPFFHEKGKRIKYKDEGPLNNSCLCSYKCTEVF